MKFFLTSLIIFLLVFLLFFYIYSNSKIMQINAPMIISLTSPVFKNNQLIPVRYTCDGVNVNPPLNISGVPQNAQSLVLIMEDPDAALGIFTHWTVWNIDPNTKEIKEDMVPAGAVEGTTSWNQPGYQGPCPGSGIHRYFFKIVALDTKIDLRESASVSQLLIIIRNHVLAEGEIMGRYARK